MKLIFGSIVLMAGSSVFFTNCSQHGFPLSQGNENQASLGSQEPSPTPSSGDLCPLLTAEKQKYPGANVKNAMDYGLKGDGVSDEYDAFQKMGTDISNHQFTTRQIVYVPKGIYYINRYMIRGGAKKNNNHEIAYKNASNFSIIGCTGALISVKGDYETTNDYKDSAWWYTYMDQIVPFSFENASNFRLSGFEIYGNNDKGTRSLKTPDGAGIAEGNSYGVCTAASSNYELSHLKVHHFSTDGIYLGGDYKTDRNVTMDDIDSYNNARQGLSIIQARTVKITNSYFRDTGYTGGAAPNYGPSGGVDIEPNWIPANGADIKTGDITFDNVHFLRNRGFQLISADNGATVENVTVSNSEFAIAPDSQRYMLALSIKGGIIQDSMINTGPGYIQTVWASDLAPISEVNTIFRRNTIRSSGIGFLMDDAGLTSKVVLENNTFISDQAPGNVTSFPLIQSGVSRFAGNILTYNVAIYGSTSEAVAVLRGITDFSNNKFNTDRTTGSYLIQTGGSTSTGNQLGTHFKTDN